MKDAKKQIPHFWENNRSEKKDSFFVNRILLV